MSAFKSRWQSISDREKWAARGATFVVKAKATKAVWLPPKPVETGTKATSRAEKATKQVADEATKKTTGAAKKTSHGTKNATKPLRRRTKT